MRTASCPAITLPHTPKHQFSYDRALLTVLIVSFYAPQNGVLCLTGISTRIKHLTQSTPGPKIWWMAGACGAVLKARKDALYSAKGEPLYYIPSSMSYNCLRYYEWLKKGKDRLPYFTRPKNSDLMLLAGLYDCTVLEGSWKLGSTYIVSYMRKGTTKPLWTFTIVTTSACSDFAWLHDRQPVILASQKALDTWLDTSPQTWTPALTDLVRPYDNALSPLEW